MKLTKGKISKLYGKKKQSLKKKVNKKKGSSRNKTFRKKRNIHLARKSLKRFHYKKQRGGIKEGEGQGDENISQESMPKVDEVSNLVTENLNQPTSETLDQSNIENVDIPTDLSATSLETDNADPVVDLSATPTVTENVDPVVDLSATPTVTENVDPVVDLSATPTVTENVDMPVVSENNESDILLSTKTTPITQPVDESNIEEPDSTSLVTDNVEKPLNFDSTSLVTDNIEKPVDFASISLEQQPTEDLTTIKSDTVPNKKELINSLSAVVDYITDAVAEKVSQKIPIQPNEGQQDGFDSVNTAAGIMAKIGGKRRKTRKFKLTKKNKTKKA
jgi:hypothetical protein